MPAHNPPIVDRRASRSASTAGFTLVELLVVVAVIGVLIAILLPVIQASRSAASRIQCMNNMRQVALAVVRHCDDFRGNFPETSHTVDTPEKAWIYKLGQYLENVDAVRICPLDPQGSQRVLLKQTSYVLNAYVTSETSAGVTNRDRLRQTSHTIVFFELADHHPPSAFEDHVHSFNWFKQTFINNKTVYKQIVGDITTKRHNGVAHYAYADGHVEAISDEQIRAWALEPYKFVLPY